MVDRNRGSDSVSRPGEKSTTVESSLEQRLPWDMAMVDDEYMAAIVWMTMMTMAELKTAITAVTRKKKVYYTL